MAIRPYAIQDPAVAASVRLPVKSAAAALPPAVEESSFRRLLGKATPGMQAAGSDDPAHAANLPQLVKMQMTASWLRMMEGTEDVERDFSTRSGVFLPAPPLPEKPDASKIRHQVEKNGDPGPEALAPLIEEAAAAYGVDANLVRSVIEVESGFRVDSLSPKGAMGLMQLMPRTARELGVDDPYDPRQNVLGGTRYLRQLIDRYGGDVRTALSAYNWGMGNLERDREKMPAETVAYVERVSQRYRELKA